MTLSHFLTSTALGLGLVSSAALADEAMMPHLETMNVWTMQVHPEAVYAPETGGYAYVSDMDRLDEGEDEREMMHALHRINLETGDVEFNWAEAGVEQPLGILSHGDTLYVVEGTNSIALYNMMTGERLARHRLPSPGEEETPSFFNDIAVSPEGRIFVSDMRRREVYALDQNGEYSLLASGDMLRSVNGLDWFNGEILTVTSTENGKVLSLHPETGAIREITEIEGERLDGIYQDGRSGVFISSIPGKIYHMNAMHEVRLVSDFASDETSANSIGGYGEGNYLLVPHYTAGTVTRYAVSYQE